MQILLLITLLIGAAFGGVIAYLVCRNSAAEQWRAKLETALQENAQLKERSARVPGLEAELAQVRLELDGTQSERDRVVTQLEAERKATDEKLKILGEAKTEFTEAFRNIANDVLDEKSRKFAQQNQDNLDKILTPFKDKLEDFKGKVEKVYDNETRLAQQVTDLTTLNQRLSKDATDLTSALKGSSKVQGDWGEFLLERILEDSGLRPDIDYRVQASFSHEDGRRGQPDVVLNLPDQKHVVIDSKISLPSYLSYVAAHDDAHRDAAITQLVQSLRSHVKDLSAKQYQDLHGLNSLDFVFIFVPSEAAFALAVSKDPELWYEANRKKVFLLSPTNLLYVLRTIADVWRAENQRQNVAKIVKAGNDLYDKFALFVDSLLDVGKRLSQAQLSYDEALDRLHRGPGNVLRKAEQLKDFGISPKKSLPAELLDASAHELPVLIEGEKPERGKVRSIAAGASEE